MLANDGNSDVTAVKDRSSTRLEGKHDMSDDKPRVSRLYLGVSAVLATILVGVFIVEFLHKNFTVNSNMVFLVTVATAIVLAGWFDELSIGQVLRLSRRVREKESEVEHSKLEASSLRANLVTLMNTIVQNQSVANNNTLHIEFGKLLGVVPAEETPEEVNEESPIEPPGQVTEQSVVVTPTDTATTVPGPGRLDYRTIRAIHREGLTRYLSERVPYKDIVYDAEFSKNFAGIDPIGDFRVQFDAYTNYIEKEYFFEAKILNRATPGMFEQLYTRLVKIWFYSQAKGVRAELSLVLIRLPEDLERTRIGAARMVDRLLTTFQPAVARGLFRVEVVDMDEADVLKLKEQTLQRA